MKNIAVDADLINALSRPFLVKAAEAARTAFNATIDDLISAAVGEKKPAPKKAAPVSAPVPAKRMPKRFKRPNGKTLIEAVESVMNGEAMTVAKLMTAVTPVYGRRPANLSAAIHRLVAAGRIVRQGEGIYRKAAQ